MVRMTERAYQEHLQKLHDEACRLGAVCGGRDKHAVVQAGDLLKGAFVDPQADLAEQGRQISRLLGDYREAIARLGTAIELEGPDAGIPHKPVGIAEQVERLIGKAAAWPATTKSEPVDTTITVMSTTVDGEKIRRADPEKHRT